MTLKLGTTARKFAISALALTIVFAGLAVPRQAEGAQVVGYLAIRYCIWGAPNGARTTTSQYIRQYYGQRSPDEQQWNYTFNRMRGLYWQPLKVWEVKVQWYYAKTGPPVKYRQSTGGPVKR